MLGVAAEQPLLGERRQQEPTLLVEPAEGEHRVDAGHHETELTTGHPPVDPPADAHLDAVGDAGRPRCLVERRVHPLACAPEQRDRELRRGLRSRFCARLHEVEVPVARAVRRAQAPDLATQPELFGEGVAERARDGRAELCDRPGDLRRIGLRSRVVAGHVAVRAECRLRRRGRPAPRASRRGGCAAVHRGGVEVAGRERRAPRRGRGGARPSCDPRSPPRPASAAGTPGRSPAPRARSGRRRCRSRGAAASTRWRSPPRRTPR